MSKFTCSGISRSFRNFRLDNVSFSMESGYFYVLVGVNGSGKTTLLNCISGITDRFTGDAQINGISLKRAPVEYRQKLGYISDMHPFFLDRSLLYASLFPGQITSRERSSLRLLLSQLVCRRLPELS